MTKSACKVLAIAAVAAGTALAQPPAGPPTAEPEQRLLEQIDALQRADGLNAEGLIEPLRELGWLYEEEGSHAKAAAALQQARQVLRANHGLFSASVDEALLLQQQIRSEKALGNGERVWNLQHDLATIARQNLDDIRMLPVFLDLIDDRAERLDVFRATSFHDLQPGLFVPCESGAMRRPPNGGNRARPVPVTDARQCPFGTWRDVVMRLRRAVLRNYADAIAVLIRNRDYGSQQLRDLEKEAMSLVPFAAGRTRPCSFQTFAAFLAADLIDSCLDPATGLGVGGWPSLMRLAFYEAHTGTPAARANAYAELGDWYLRADHLSRTPRFSAADVYARALYEQALAELEQGDDARESMEKIFAPELPMTLPTYAQNLLASTKSSRYIDVAFAIARDGTAAEIVILDTGKGAKGAEERELVRVIKYASFRPRVVDGKIAEAAPVTVRYYLPELPLVSSASAGSTRG